MILNTAQREFIHDLAPLSDGVGKHAAFIKVVLREPLFDTAIMANAMADEPLTEAGMLHTAEHWADEEPDHG